MENNTETTEAEVYTFSVPKKTIKKILLVTGAVVATGTILTSAVRSANREAELESLRHEKEELEAVVIDETTETPTEITE